ncbi:HNH endonuclease [Archangium gephyra]|uniref:HNH endonuclease n=1 Tax=Archangium gephyra TaxID=48 RepID=UPI003B804D21
MEKELEQFRQEVERLRAGRNAGSGPFPEPLCAFAMRYLAYAQEKGDTLKAVVERLGGVGADVAGVATRADAGGGALPAARLARHQRDSRHRHAPIQLRLTLPLLASVPGGIIPPVQTGRGELSLPDFSPYALKTVGIPFSGDRKRDAVAANAAAGFKHTLTGYTWHHHQDGRPMQLVPTDRHRAISHTGGHAAQKALEAGE